MNKDEQKRSAVEAVRIALEKQGNETMFDDFGGLAFIQPSMVADLLGEVERMRKALEHYGDPKRWACHYHSDYACKTCQIGIQVYNYGNANGFEVAQEVLAGGEK